MSLKKTEEELTLEILAKLTNEQIMELPRRTLNKYCKAMRFDTRARKQDLQDMIKKRARTLRQHENRKQKNVESKKRRGKFVMFKGQQKPESYPGARGSYVSENSNVAGKVRGLAMTGNIEEMKCILQKLRVEDRRKIVNAGGTSDFAAGDNALHYACWRGQRAVAEWLLKNCDADLNLQGRNGLSPLHHALKGKAEATILWLLESGASVFVKDDVGKTPLEMCLDMLDDIEEEYKIKLSQAELRGTQFEENHDEKRERELLESIKRLLAQFEAKQMMTQHDIDGINLTEKTDMRSDSVLGTIFDKGKYDDTKTIETEETRNSTEKHFTVT